MNSEKGTHMEKLTLELVSDERGNSYTKASFTIKGRKGTVICAEIGLPKDRRVSDLRELQASLVDALIRDLSLLHSQLTEPEE